MAADNYLIYDSAWTRPASEMTLQQALINLMRLLNSRCGHHDPRLFWDFTIYDKETLGGSLPDGHARLSDDPTAAKNIFEQAVLLEVKPPGLFEQGIGEHTSARLRDCFDCLGVRPSS